MFTNFLILFSSSAGLASATKEWYSGWNLPSNNPDSTCKTSADWAADFAVLNGPFKDQYGAGKTAVKVFTSNGCDTVIRIVQPAIDANIPILASIEANEAHFPKEKAALETVIKMRGCDWLAAVSVGSEELLRKEVSGDRMVAQINDVRGMIRQYQSTFPSCGTVPVSHADVPSAFLENPQVIQASDFVLLNAYAYWGGAVITSTQASIQGSIDVVQKISNGKETWIGETGHPTAGPAFGYSVASIENLRTAWVQLKCPQVASGGHGGPLFGTNSFWYAAFDQPFRNSVLEQNFGVATADKKLKISLFCL